MLFQIKVVFIWNTIIRGWWETPIGTGGR